MNPHDRLLAGGRIAAHRQPTVRNAVTTGCMADETRHEASKPCETSVSLVPTDLVPRATKFHMLLQWRMHGCVVRASRFVSLVSVPLEVPAFPHTSGCLV
jgi:hypothetical protein